MAERTAPSFSAESTLSGLKRFQRRTVDYIFKRMYQDEDRTTRFLVADEVGLGKTLVAKGVIAKAIEHLRSKHGQNHRIDIVYICSNASIARQNVSRLNVVGGSGYELASRITLLPIQLRSLESNPHKINIISFTPATSFDQKSSIGMLEERALLFAMLREPWNLNGAAPLNILQGNVQNPDYFRQRALEEKDINPEISRRFIQLIGSSVNSPLRKDFEALCSQFQRARKSKRPDEQRAERNRIIGVLRGILAEACIDSLEPDIVILDEFQRFRHLLSNDDECSELARRLFDYVDHQTNTRVHVLLLSATPYKMYTLREEASGDDHYSDFIQTYRFLERDPKRHAEFEVLLRSFRDLLLSPEQLVSTELATVKNRIEDLLRRVMVRTERLAATEDRNGMLRDIAGSGRRLNAMDVRSYIGVDGIATELNAANIVEYWKSSPYLLNFMDDYHYKKCFDEKSKQKQFREKVLKRLANGASIVLLSEDDIRAYKPVDPCNAKMRNLFEDILDKDAWKALWIPPCLPYYELGEPFQTIAKANFTKQLIFSTWKVVPKAVSVMMSYEAERRMNSLSNKARLNTSEARRRRRPLLRFAVAEGRETGMPLMGFIYPSICLAKNCDPMTLASEQSASGSNNLPSLSKMVSRVSEKVKILLDGLKLQVDDSDVPDETWYYAVSFILDETYTKAGQYLIDSSLAARWAVHDEETDQTNSDEDEVHTHFSQHVERIRSLILSLRDGSLKLGRKPDDLIEVISLLAIAGPGTCALRALSRRINGEANPDKSLWMDAAQIGLAFISLFNSPDVTSLIRGMDDREPYWRRVLEYCANGGIQSVLDEYVHVLYESLGLLDKPDVTVSKRISGAIHEAMTLRTARLGVDNIDLATMQKVGHFESFGRVHFALRFGDEHGDDGSLVTRSEQVRGSFNSPFWPFVLATTSIGQEGLDFHQYCHAVVHWNLPSNPVDLEQREGRIHRYKNHALRKNLAQKYGDSLKEYINGDIWEKMFQNAWCEFGEASDDIIPYWVFQVENGAHIERHIPCLALSRDIEKMARLRKSLAAYRMVFGQPRQEDMMEYMLAKYHDMEIAKLCAELRINLSPPQNEESS